MEFKIADNCEIDWLVDRADTPRVMSLRKRVRASMELPVQAGDCPVRIADEYMSEPLAVRKARAVALKLASMPTDLWDGQLFAGSLTLENPRVHYEPGKAYRGAFAGFPDYATPEEAARAAEHGLSVFSVMGHIVPDYPRLMKKGLLGIMADARAQRANAQNDEELAFLDSVEIAVQAVIDFAARLADACEAQARTCADETRAVELAQMAANLRHSPANPPSTFWEALQSVWLLHMCFHATFDWLALGRLDQYVWPFLKSDLEAGRLTLEQAAELVDCFTLKFNERAKTTEDQLPVARKPEEPRRHGSRGRRARNTSSQAGSQRDQIDATNHWLQNIVISGLTPEGEDGTNPVTFLLLESYRRNQMTNPLLAVRLHRNSPEGLLYYVCEVLREGGGMPAIFNDEQLVPALERAGIPTPDARDYTNDGCWEVIVPGRTDFRFTRLSMMLCLEWALNRGVSRVDGSEQGIDTGDPRSFATFEDVWNAFAAQLDVMASELMQEIVAAINDRAMIAPVPLLSAMIDGAIENRRDMTAGGAKFRTYALLAESVAYAIDSLAAIKKVIYDDRAATMDELLAALDANFEGYAPLRSKLAAAPKYGCNDPYADQIGRRMIELFTDTINRHAEQYRDQILFPAGVGTFSWYIGIGEGLGASPDGRLAGDSVSPNFSPALGRDTKGLPAAILSYGAMHEYDLPAGGPLDLRVNRSLVRGEEGLERMVGLVRTFVETGGNMLTLTVVDTEELRAAQREPDKFKSLRVRMGGWCAYFTTLSREQQDHHIRRQENGR
ncbi:MAG: pyruvate formate lyase family protein [Anaerolineales bacterium]